MGWRARTRRDESEAPATQACACGRVVPTDMLVDVRALPAALRAGRTYLCDGCRERLLRSGQITRVDFARALGAPEHVLTKLERAVTRREAQHRGR